MSRDSPAVRLLVWPLLSWHSPDLVDDPALSALEEHFDAQCVWPPPIGSRVQGRGLKGLRSAVCKARVEGQGILSSPAKHTD
jgi:hypothetical protein